MSRPQTTQLTPVDPVLRQGLAAPQGPAGEWISALVDGECPETHWAALLKDGTLADEGSLQRSWMEFHQIGETLRAGEVAMPVPSRSFADTVMARIAMEQPVASSSLPNSVGEVAVEPSPALAANDAVFRWKLVAGVASLAAVVAVAWQLTVAPSTGLPGGGVGPQLATVVPGAAGAAPEAALAASAVVAAPRETVVSTEAGVLLRDPELEAFIAAHRQSGGMSALQMPAGFLRNATFEAPQR